MTKRIKVAMLTHSTHIGGAERIPLNYMLDFKHDQDIELKLFVSNSNKHSDYDREIAENNYNVKYLGDKFVSNKNQNIIIKIINKINRNLCLFKELRKFKPDIVHNHQSWEFSYTLLPMLLSGAKLLFSTLHSNPIRFKGLALNLNKLAFKQIGIKPICLNQYQAELAQKIYGFKNYDILHNGIDIGKIESKIINKSEVRKILNIPQDAFVICGVGHLVAIKRFDLLIDAFSVVKRQKQNSILVFAGDGDELEKLQKKVQKYSLSDSVIFLGNISNVIPLYCASDLCCITSITESMCLVLLEAQLCNLRCIISDGVPHETIVTQLVSRVKSNATPEDWAKAILEIKPIIEQPSFNKIDYDIHSVSQKLKDIYLREYNLIKKNNV